MGRRYLDWRQIGIMKWELCKFWLSSVSSIEIILHLEMVVQGHVFTISVMIMDLLQKEAYLIVVYLFTHDMKHNNIVLA
jgi:hypothetical protein